MSANKGSKDKVNQEALVVYQFRADLGYPIFLQFKDLEIEQELQFIIHELGFSLSKLSVLEEASKDRKYKILRISAATPKVLKKITSYSQHAFGLGQELVENFGYYEVYVMMRYAMMIMSQSGFQWEMAIDKDRIISQTQNKDVQNAIKLSLNRFLSSSLAFLEVMAFWGTIKNKFFTLANQAEAQNGCVFVDIKKNLIFAQSQASLNINECQIIVLNEKNVLLKEEIYSSLASRALYFSSGQIPRAYMIQNLTQLVRNIKQSPSTIEKVSFAA